MMGIHWNHADGPGVWIWLDDETRLPAVKWALEDGLPRPFTIWQPVPEETHAESWIKERIRDLIREAVRV
jgi:hypothetical protein